MNVVLDRTGLHGPVQLCHFFLEARLSPGDRVVDATCGNGKDTLFLARLVGKEGRVWALDIQEAALAATRELLSVAGCLAQVELLAAGHERLAELVTGPLAAVVFNLGYLPGGDKGCVTRPETTLRALAAALELLRPGGVIVAVLYPGHVGGADECGAVEAWAAALPRQVATAWRQSQLNSSATAPYLLLVEKR